MSACVSTQENTKHRDRDRSYASKVFSDVVFWDAVLSDWGYMVRAPIWGFLTWIRVENLLLVSLKTAALEHETVRRTLLSQFWADVYSSKWGITSQMPQCQDNVFRLLGFRAQYSRYRSCYLEILWCGHPNKVWDFCFSFWPNPRQLISAFFLFVTSNKITTCLDRWVLIKSSVIVPFVAHPHFIF